MAAPVLILDSFCAEVTTLWWINWVLIPRRAVT
jgi:hypothetical protein